MHTTVYRKIIISQLSEFKIQKKIRNEVNVHGSRIKKRI